jgi:anti-sigma B factor antagonist
VAQHGTIEVEVHSATVSIVTLRGEHDLDSSAQIRGALAGANGRSNVVVDLSQCSFMDSSVISVLLRASNRLHERGGQLALVIPGDRHQAIRRLFDLMSIDRLMPTYEARAAAISDIDVSPPRTTAPRTTRLRALSEIIDLSLIDTDDQRHAA